MSRGDGAIEAETDGRPRALVVRFWTLVLLFKLIVLIAGGGVLLLAVTSYDLAGFALVLIAAGVGVRWIQLYRRGRASASTHKL